MTEDELRTECEAWLNDHGVGSHVGGWRPRTVAALMALCTRMQAEGLREAADAANTLGLPVMRAWCLVTATERDAGA